MSSSSSACGVMSLHRSNTDRDGGCLHTASEVEGLTCYSLSSTMFNVSVMPIVYRLDQLRRYFPLFDLARTWPKNGKWQILERARLDDPVWFVFPGGCTRDLRICREDQSIRKSGSGDYLVFWRRLAQNGKTRVQGRMKNGGHNER